MKEFEIDTILDFGDLGVTPATAKAVILDKQVSITQIIAHDVGVLKQDIEVTGLVSKYALISLEEEFEKRHMAWLIGRTGT
jgi:hypothetical protein